jgi:hypothetical protein
MTITRAQMLRHLEGRANPVMMAEGGKVERPGALSAIWGAMRGMLSPGGDLNPTGGLVEPSLQGVMDAGDFAAEMVNPAPGIDRSIEMARQGDYGNALVEGALSMPMIATFAGRAAKTADLPALERAEKMAASGADRRAVWDETGWFKGPDGQWRFEIDDSGARFNSDIVGERTYGSGSYSDAVSHPELYKAYPDLGNIDTRVEIMPQRGGSYLRPESREHLGLFDIAEEIGAKGQPSRHSKDGILDPLLHEGQHAIQAREGFAGGGNMSVGRELSAEPVMGDIQALQDYIQNTRRAVRSAGEIGPFERSQLEMIADAEKELAALQSRVSGRPKTAFEAYERIAGEVEARNVETRRAFSPDQRRARPPWETQDVPDDMQIIRGRSDGPQMSVELPMDEASRMARAREMGVTESGYHGTGADIGSFNGMTWMSDSPRLANDYAAMRGMEGGSDNVMPLMMRPGQTFEADALPRTVTVGDMVNELLEQANAAGRSFDEPRIKKLLDSVRAAARREESGPHYGRHDFWNNSETMFGRDGAKALHDLFDELGFNSVRMTEGGERTIGVFNPADVRSRFAAFDPAKRDSSDILASMAPIGLGTVGALPLLTDRER